MTQLIQFTVDMVETVDTVDTVDSVDSVDSILRHVQSLTSGSEFHQTSVDVVESAPVLSLTAHESLTKPQQT